MDLSPALIFFMPLRAAGRKPCRSAGKSAEYKPEDVPE